MKKTKKDESNNIIMFPSDRIVRIVSQEENGKIESTAAVINFIDENDAQETIRLTTELMKSITKKLNSEGLKPNQFDETHMKSYLFMAESISAFCHSINRIPHPLDSLVEASFDLDDQNNFIFEPPIVNDMEEEELEEDDIN